MSPQPAGLDALLERLPRPGSDGEAVDDWIDDAAAWLLHGARGPGRDARLQALTDRLCGEGEDGPLTAFLRDAWQRTSVVRFLAESGIAARPSFLGEAWSRVVDRVLPRLDGRFDLASLLFRLGLTPDDMAWLESLPPEARQPFADRLPWSRAAVGTAARVVALRAGAVGLSRPLLRLASVREEDWPFLDVPDVVRAATEGDRLAPAAQAAWQRCRGRCVGALRNVRAALDLQGVSTEVLFLLELAEAQLARIDVLLALLDEPSGAYAVSLGFLRASIARRGLRVLVRSKLKRLALEIVEHTGHTGEHYVSNTWSEFRQMGRAAALGGAVTAVTAVLKYVLAGAGLASGLLGLALAANYALSFLLIHFLGGSLASKQPAMTAAALARSLGGEASSITRVRLIAGISRAQAAATAGNLLLAFPAALLLDELFVRLRGTPVLGAEAAHHSLAALHPFHSGTLAFAALTGVLLWMSSMASGLAANWSDFRSLPEAIRHSAACRRGLGGAGAARLAAFVRAHVAGIVSYSVLGVLLGFLPAALGFMGLPVEVRHVTLSGASVALAISGQARAGHVDGAAAAWALLGVLLIGFLNFAVSFALAFSVALRARDLAGGDRRLLWRQLWTAFSRRPTWFLVPPRPAAD
jgi:site-specific recombinase